MGKVKKRDNSSFILKRNLRAEIAAALPADAVVLEGFAGEGKLWRAVWSRFRGVCVDLFNDKVEAAAIERSTWGCYQGDTGKLLAAGFCSTLPFAVVDLDAYGSPWPFLRAWFLSERERAERTVVIMTDGYLSRASMASPCKALFGEGQHGRRDLPVSVYLAQARERVAEWAHAAGLASGPMRSLAGPDGKMWQHVVEVTQPDGRRS